MIVHLGELEYAVGVEAQHGRADLHLGARAGGGR